MQRIFRNSKIVNRRTHNTMMPKKK